MRHASLLLTALLCAAAPAWSQVTVNLQALDALPGATRPSTHQPVPRRTAAARTKRAAHHNVAQKPATTPQTARTQPAPIATPPGTPPTAAPVPPDATLPTAAPATVALAPVPPPPAAPEPVQPPPPPPISDSAASAATATHAGLRVSFGVGEADLSPASAAAIKGVVQSAPTGDDTTFNVVAYAAGTPEDPSTARRLSLSRALAVRSALMADGIASSRIYVRALGAATGSEDPDRVDLAVMGGNASAATPANAPAATAGGKSQPQ
jgi:outer membrane protein OmpA-like peptidoglycan-associated protein